MKKAIISILIAVIMGLVCVFYLQRSQKKTISAKSSPIENDQGSLNVGSDNDTEEILLKRLLSKDEKESLSAAKAIGDLSISGKQLCPGNQHKVDSLVGKCLMLTKSKSMEDRSKAKMLIHSLWHAAVPELCRNLSNPKELSKAELAAKSLILMRNRDIVLKLIDMTRMTKDRKSLRLVIFTLKHMKETRRASVPNRQCLSVAESRKLYDELIVPALAELGVSP